MIKPKLLTHAHKLLFAEVLMFQSRRNIIPSGKWSKALAKQTIFEGAASDGYSTSNRRYWG